MLVKYCPNIFEIRFNFESTSIIISTSQVMGVFSVQSSGKKSWRLRRPQGLVPARLALARAMAGG